MSHHPRPSESVSARADARRSTLESPMTRALVHWALWAIGSFLVAATLICGLAWLIDLIQGR